MLTETIRIIDTDSHISEPPDLWTTRLSRRWGDDVPHVEVDPRVGEPCWIIGGKCATPVAGFAAAGWRDYYPSHPPSLEEADAGAFDPHARLDRLDQYGVYAQVLYPNLLAFFTPVFRDLGPLGLECVRAYNDFQVDFASADPDRLLPLTVLPFWDIEASVAEMERCATNGHRGVLFGATFDQIGLPTVDDEHWTPIFEAAQHLGQSINFHIGFASTTADMLERATPVNMTRTVVAELSVNGFLSNARAITALTLRGVCQRFPRLNFVSVESGFGYIPFLLEALDWQFVNNGLRRDHPDWLLPSEVFRRQIYATFWFEHLSPGQAEDFQDNLMFETDFPHPTSLSPGPNSTSDIPVRVVEKTLASVSDGARRKLLHDNAARLYRVA